MCLALCDVVVVLKMNWMVYWEIWISRINNTFGRSIAGVRQVDSWGAFGTVVKITCAHLSQKIFVHNMRPLNSVIATDSSEHCNINRINVRVNCEATVFGGDACWIVRETITFIFNFQNICIQFVKQSGNKMANYLALFVFQPGCMISWGFVPIESLLSH